MSCDVCDSMVSESCFIRLRQTYESYVPLWIALESLIFSGVSGRIVLRHSENSLEYWSAKWESVALEVMSQQCLQEKAEKCRGRFLSKIWRGLVREENLHENLNITFAHGKKTELSLDIHYSRFHQPKKCRGDFFCIQYTFY